MSVMSYTPVFLVRQNAAKPGRPEEKSHTDAKEALINSTVCGEVLSLTKGRTMNAKHCKIIMLYGSPFDKLRANGINQRFLSKCS